MKSIFLKTTLSLFIFLPVIVSAKETCHIEQFQPVDIQPEISGGVLDKESGQFLITQKPPMRCATVTFSTSTTRNRIADQMSNHFEATYFDNQMSNSHSITFDEDAVKAGYIRVGPNNPVDAYVCFETSETPIKDITCDVK